MIRINLLAAGRKPKKSFEFRQKVPLACSHRPLMKLPHSHIGSVCRQQIQIITVQDRDGIRARLAGI